MKFNLLLRARWLVAVMLLLLTLTVMGGTSAQQSASNQTLWQTQVNDQLQDITRYDYHHLNVKFTDDSGIRVDAAGQAVSLAGVDVSGFNALLTQYAVTSVQRTFNVSTPEMLDQQRAQRIARMPGQRVADLNSYLTVRLDPSVAAGTAANLLAQLNALPQIDVAYAEPIPQPATLDPNEVASLRLATDIPPTTPDYTGSQGYLYTPGGSNGVNAESAWAYAGGRGDNVRVIDIEGGWTLTHEDLNTTPSDLIHGVQSTDPGWYHHGTAVIGVVAGVENDYGVTGIAPNSEIKVASIFGSGNSTANALLAAYNNTQTGDVILIELHAGGPNTGFTCTCNEGQCGLIAMEFWQANFDVIQMATQDGRHVVAAAGNGSMDLDHPAYGGAFDYNVRDSGSILVGAGTSNARVPHCWTNFGSRVDVHGWGDSVVTLGYGGLFDGGGDLDQYYTSTFSGTSSASPIVTASVAVVQSVAEAENVTINPFLMRLLLRATGTPQTDPTKQIGPLPNITAALDGLLNNLPPITSNDSDYTVTIGSTLNVTSESVLNNDIDINIGDVLSAVLDTGSSQGTVNLNSDGTFTYTPDFGASGSDSFTYLANDGTANSAATTVSININLPAGTPPRVYPLDTDSIVSEYDWPRFTFLHIDDAEWYQIWIGTDDYMGTPAVFDWFEAAQICSGGVCTIPMDLWLTNGDYAWWVTHWGPNASDIGNQWDDTTFSVDFATPGTSFVLSAPTGTVSTAPAEISWQRDTAVLWYQMWVGLDDYSDTIFFDWIDATENCDDVTCILDVSDASFADGGYEVWVEMWGPNGYVTWPATANATFTLDTGGGAPAPVDQPAREPATEPLTVPADTGSRGG